MVLVVVLVWLFNVVFLLLGFVGSLRCGWFGELSIHVIVLFVYFLMLRVLL